MRKASVYGKKADRYQYQLGDVKVSIDRLDEPVRGHKDHWVWAITEPKKHAKKRADATGEATFPHVHISVIKISQSFKSWGKALISAIEYLNRKRQEGEL